MPMLSQPSFGPRTALTYVTVGSLIDVWTGVWYVAFRDPSHPLSNTATFWIFGLFLSGLTLVVIGLLVGPLGRSARKVELPPAEATPDEARIQHATAATPHPVVAAASRSASPPVTVTNPRRQRSRDRFWDDPEIQEEQKVVGFDFEGTRPKDNQTIGVDVTADGKMVHIEQS